MEDSIIQIGGGDGSCTSEHACYEGGCMYAANVCVCVCVLVVGMVHTPVNMSA